MKRKKYKILLYLIAFILIYVYRFDILKAIGNYLIVEDEIEYVETAFVLSGGAFDRGNKAASLINEKKIGKIICTGANKPPDFKALKIDMLESELTRKNIISQIEDSTSVSLLKAGTSTMEESYEIFNYCKENNIHKCVIISSKFHTRRINSVFREKANDMDIKLFIVGSASSSFNENEWWKSENGLITLNNEYIKLVYYFFKYKA